MAPDALERKTCRLCRSSNVEVVLPLEPTPIADAYIKKGKIDEIQKLYPLDVFLCHDCGLVQLLEVIDPKLLYGNFLYETSISLGLVGHFKKYADDIAENLSPPKGALAVDIGSNDGTLLKFLKNKGMRILGIDPAGAIAEKATKNGVKTLPDFFSPGLAQKIRNEYGPAYIITSNNTIANIHDLDRFVAGIHHLLDPKGVFIFETVYLVDLLQKGVFDNIYHEHLSYFSIRPLKKLLGKSSLELINAERIPTKEGSIRCFAQHIGGPGRISQSVNDLLKLEDEVGVGNAKAYGLLAAKLDAAKNELNKLLKRLKEKGSRIAGYCASQSVTTLLYHFKIGGFIEVIFDDNPIKHHTYSPGIHIPVLPPDEIYRLNPDYIVILAWRYSEPIIKKHQAYLNKGGRFIIPYPALKIIGKDGSINY